LSYLLVHLGEDEGEVVDEIVLKQIFIGDPVILAYRINEVEMAQ
jgi:hypothetical protein